MFHRWRQMDDEERQRGGVWRLYGWYSGLMLFGSCFGAVTWAAWMQVLVNEFTAQSDSILLAPQERLLLFSLSHRWDAVFRVTYAIEFLCLSVAKLLVLDRMTSFAVSFEAGSFKSRLWAIGWPIVIACVVVGNLVGLAGNVAASVLYVRLADLLAIASTNVAVNVTFPGRQSVDGATDLFDLALDTSSVQQFSEVSALLIIVLTFAIVGVACARQIACLLFSHRPDDPKMAATRHLQQQILGTTAVVFITFLIRSAFSTLYAVAYKLQDNDKTCPGATDVCNASCHNVFTLIEAWLFFTPEFQLIIVLLSAPLPLLVALWGMTSVRTLQPQAEMQERKARTPSRSSFWKRDSSLMVPLSTSVSLE
jgi:hypothetical protein